MNHILKWEQFLFIVLLFCPFALHADNKSQTIKEVKDIIDNFSGGTIEPHLYLSLSKTMEGHDRYSTSVKNNKLTIKGSSGVALCHAFYQYIKSKQAGICSWSGNRFETPTLSSQKEEVVESPYRDHYYLNVVTFGYTMPYWSQSRWDQEIDWMALHGIDMPLNLVANEAISRRVFKKLGITDEELDTYFVGPAHLPWMRMGNISGACFDGPLSTEWHKQQIALQHHLMKRMHKLGMKPICPAFGGFVPASIKNHFPKIQLEKTSWGNISHNYRLSPTDPFFYKIGKLFIEEWEREFGKNTYYLSDSFNEMDIPKDLNTLTQYGDIIYKTIHDANPDAVWTMQGWMLGYQRNNWTTKTLPALIKNVPDNKMLILDMSTDYNKDIWKNNYSWEYFPKMYGKQWVWSVIPNMGGKVAFTGKLEYYANGRLDALHSANKGKLTGYGFAPEGIENNEIIYELLSDGGWTNDSINLNKWLDNYASCRYGKEAKETQNKKSLQKYYTGLQKSVYGSFTPHPRFAWQFSPYHNQGSVNTNEAFYQGIEQLVSTASGMISSPLFRTDLIEASVLYGGGKAEILVAQINKAIETNHIELAKEGIRTFTSLMLQMDALLENHPLHRLSRWEKMAQDAVQCTQSQENKSSKKQYAINARRIVSTWGKAKDQGISDYSARIWSGLIRDYYLPRWLNYFSNKMGKTKIDMHTFEDNWVASAPTLSENKSAIIHSNKGILTACEQLINDAKVVTSN